MISFFKDLKKNHKIAIFGGLVLLAYTISYYFFHTSHPGYFQYSDYVVGMVGFAFLTIEIISLKTTAESTETAILATHKAISVSRQIFSLGHSASLTKQIIASNRERKFELSIDRLHELRRQLAHIEAYNAQQDSKHSKKLHKMRANISTQLTIIEEKLPQDEQTIDSQFLSRLMHEVLDLLNTIEASVRTELPRP